MLWVHAQFRQPSLPTFQGVQNPGKEQKALQESEAFSQNVSPQSAPPKTLLSLKKRLKHSFEQLGALPFLHSMTLLVASMVGAGSVSLGLSQNDNVRHALQNSTPEVFVNLPRLKFQHYFTMSMLGLNLGVLTFFITAIARLTQKSLREKHADLLQAEAQEAYLAVRSETEPHQQRMAQALQNHIRGQLSAMAAQMASTAKNNPMAQAELVSVFGAKEAPPSEERLTQLFHYLTTVSIRHSQQQAVDGKPPVPPSESEYLMKMAALVEIVQLRGNLFEGLADDTLLEGEEFIQTLEPQMFKLLALAETRMQSRAEQLADDLQEMQALGAAAQRLREEMKGQQESFSTQEQIRAVDSLGARLHALTHRRYLPLFLPEEVEPLGLNLPLESLHQEAHHQASLPEVESVAPETLSARLDEVLQELSRATERPASQAESRGA